MYIGIYYVTMLLSLLGPVKEVCGFWTTRNPDRIHYSLAREDAGQPYLLESENLVSACIRLNNEAHGTIHLNANSTQNEQPHLIIYGTEGILYLPDPNQFGGEVRLAMKGQYEPIILPHTHAFDENSRGLGVAELAWSLNKGKPHRTSARMAVHAVELLCGIEDSAQSKRFYSMLSSFERPEPLPRGYLGRRYSNSDPENGLGVD